MKMIVSLIIFGLLVFDLQSCYGLNLFNKEKKNVDVDALEYTGDPITFACVYTTGTNDVEIARSDNELEVANLIEKIGNTGRGLSIYFTGIGTIMEEDNKKYDTQGWLAESDTNVCYIGYQFADTKTIPIKLLPHTRKMVKSNRVQFVARETRNFVLGIRNQCNKSKVKGCLAHMSQVTVVGYSLGAHIGSFFCRYLETETKEKVKMLLGLDPAGVSLWIDEADYIRSGDATYVQIIHSTARTLGTHRLIGDVDIILDYNCNGLNLVYNHRLPCFLHELIAPKKAFFIAQKNGNGRIINLRKRPELKSKAVALDDNEILVGVYGEKPQKLSSMGKNVYKLSIYWADCKKTENIMLATIAK